VKPERNDEIGPALRAAALDLMDQRNFHDQELLLSNVVTAAVDTIPGADAGGISMVSRGSVDSRTPSNGGVTKLDRLQSELHEGPCITAIEEPAADGLVVVDDLSHGDGERWPRFAPEAVEQGYRAMLGVQLSQQPEMQAALNLYGSQPRVFDEHAQVTAGLFGSQAAMLLYGAEQTRALQAGIDSRDVIAQARGILIERHGVTGDEAFQMLVTSSRRSAIDLVDVAAWVVTEAEQGQNRRDRPADDH
jgi:hypothetical protein